MTTDDDDEPTEAPLSTVDYSVVFGNALQRKRLYKAIGSGLDPDEGPDFRAKRFQSTSESVRKLVS